MSIPYRTKRAFKGFFTGLLALSVFAVLVLVCWLLWLNRYVIYSADGAKIDFDLPVRFAQGETAGAPEPAGTVPIYGMTTEEEPEAISRELTRFSGYYVTLKELTGDIGAVIAKLEALPEGSTVMLELKSVNGYTYYSSTVAATNPKFDTTQVDALIQKLIDGGYYVIAQIPAFQEYYYIMENERERVAYGLPKTGGSSLWLDGDYRCYWLNPASDGTMTYLIQLLTELRSLGIHEVVFSDFRFPSTTKVSFDGNKTDTLNAAAATLVKTCATDKFCVSFTRSAVDLELPGGRTRLYLTDIAAADAAETAAKTSFADPTIQLVFLTELSDTRYDEYCVLRPLDSAH